MNNELMLAKIVFFNNLIIFIFEYSSLSKYAIFFLIFVFDFYKLAHNFTLPKTLPFPYILESQSQSLLLFSPFSGRESQCLVGFFGLAWLFRLDASIRLQLIWIHRIQHPTYPTFKAFNLFPFREVRERNNQEKPAAFSRIPQSVLSLLLFASPYLLIIFLFLLLSPLIFIHYRFLYLSLLLSPLSFPALSPFFPLFIHK